MAPMPTHEFKGRGTWESKVSFEPSRALSYIPSVMIKHNRLAPDWVSVSEIANPGNVISRMEMRERPRFAHLVISLP